MLEITIDTYLCSGCATCAEMCPAVFSMDPVLEKAELVNITPEATDDVYLAAAFCPEKCIDIKE
jgi:ferredoxin